VHSPEKNVALSDLEEKVKKRAFTNVNRYTEDFEKYRWTQLRKQRSRVFQRIRIL